MMPSRRSHLLTRKAMRRIPGSRSLRGRLMLALGGLMVLQMAYFAFFWLPHGRQWAVDQSTRQVEEHLQTLGDSLVPHLLQRQLAAVNETMAYVQQRQPHWHKLTLVNAQGVRIFPLVGESVDEGWSGEPVSQPILHHGTELGTISLELDQRALSAAHAEQSRRLGLVMILVSLGAMLLAGGIVEWLVIRPAVSLRKAALQMARGNYEAEVPRPGGGEIGTLVRTFSEMRDDIQLQQENLREAKEEAEAASKSKSLFLATMSHEIRTPLNGIIAVAHMLKKTPMAQQQREFLTTILRSANHLLAVISDILDFSKIEAGKLDLAPREMCPCHLFEDLNRLLRPLAESRGIGFTHGCQGPKGLRILADEDRLRQVMLNLGTNAIKFTEVGTVHMFCEAEETEETADGNIRLVFSMADTGIGMTPEVITRVFERFMQADPTYTRRVGGTGLGLAISKQIVELMGGRMEVESEEGVGTVFRFSVELPLVKRTEKPKTAPVASLSPLGGKNTPPLRILVAEDDEINQYIIENLLRMERHRGSVVHDGQAALEACTSEVFDAIIMDMQMPVMDGLEATRRIRALGGFYRTVPIIGLTANASAEARQECEAAGMSHYLTKPMNPDHLVEMLDEIGRQVAMV